MEEETSWITDCFDDIGCKFTDISEFESFSEISNERDNVNAAVSLDFILPDDLLERILAYLPIASIFRAGCVCKRWNEIVNSRKLNVFPQRPWYFMFTSSDEPIGYAYDPILRKWVSPLSSTMEEETSWITDCFDDIGSKFTDISEFESFSEISNERDNVNAAVSLDFILPDDLLERILAYLPIASIFRAGCVCKRWNEIVNSRKLNVFPQRPWYFMFTSSDEPIGYAYDPILRKWYCLELPCIETSNSFIASSCGLVCFMDNDSRSELFVCNPITKDYKRLDEPPGLKYSDYSALAVSVNRMSHTYTVAIAKCKQVPDNFFQWDLSIDVYDSETMTWVTSATEVLTGWRGGDESVICDGILYFLIYSTGGGRGWLERHGLIMYDFSNRSSHGILMRIPVPCSLTCGRLMNLRDKLVMVGGIGKPDRPDIIKGIGIWILNGKDWQEVSRMPNKFFQGFGEFDDVFASSGSDDLIYIQSYGAPALLVFDMSQKQWKWSQKCPVTKRFPLQLFTGFCFEPRLEVAP